MGAMVPHITSLTIVYSNFYSGAGGDSQMFPFDDVIMDFEHLNLYAHADHIKGLKSSTAIIGREYVPPNHTQGKNTGGNSCLWLFK